MLGGHWCRLKYDIISHPMLIFRYLLLGQVSEAAAHAPVAALHLTVSVDFVPLGDEAYLQV